MTGSPKIPYVDLAAQHAPIKERLLQAVGEVLDRGDFILGEAVGRFEARMAAYCGVRHAVGLNSGTDALFLALKAWGIGPGDEVITAPNSFLASASSIAAAGATPVFADIREDLNIDPDQVRAAVTPRTKAIMPVHLTGRPADMVPILEIAREHGLRVVEDAAQAAGAAYQGVKVGAWGDAGCFSLHPLKTLNACGDGGLVTTNDDELARTLRQLRNIGLKNRDESELWGFNSRLDSLQAAILDVKLGLLDEWNEARRRNAAFYSANLADCVEVPGEKPGEFSVYHTYVIQADRRDELQRRLEEEGIGTRVHYPIPIHLQKAAAALGCRKGDFPVCERAAGRILSLPVYHGLTQDALSRVVSTIRSFYGRGSVRA